MLVSIVGHASFQTADRRGPSMIDRSNRVGVRAGGLSGSEARLAGRVTSVKGSLLRSAVDVRRNKMAFHAQIR
jgi:hypothetical protein